MQYTYYMPKSVSKQLHCILSLSFSITFSRSSAELEFSSSRLWHLAVNAVRGWMLIELPQREQSGTIILLFCGIDN